MFGDKLATAQKQIASLTALIASTGFKVEAGAEPSADALKAHLSSQTKAAVDAAVAPITEQLASSNSRYAALISAIDSAGIKLGDTAAPADLPAALKTALDAAISARSARQISAAGHPHAIETPSGDTKDASSMSATELAAAIGFEKDPAKRKSLFNAYEKRFLKG